MAEYPVIFALCQVNFLLHSYSTFFCGQVLIQSEAVEMFQGDVARLPKNAKSRIEASASFSEALDILMEITGELGFTQVLYAYQPVRPQLPSGDWLPLKLNVRNFPKGFEDGWERFMKIDPYYRACFDGTLPIDWVQVQASEQLASIQREACAYLGDFGLSRGITVPAHLPFGRFAVMSAIIDRTKVEWDSLLDQTREPLFSLMHLFTKVIFDLKFESQIDVVRWNKLTPRELECLRWASAGKTSSETSIILGRSLETVRLHIKNAIAKLDAANRSQAVAMAIRLGLI
ncbi:helix-turn-helix transcriptional regulator [Aminobacter sp. LjRoot7]|uniref:helix-turn-helix transcriptional regulator n=1 Tax=Aminobacter sp. LjRoot7 TaxID=3342335 RepID=UPI003F50579A